MAWILIPRIGWRWVVRIAALAAIPAKTIAPPSGPGTTGLSASACPAKITEATPTSAPNANRDPGWASEKKRKDTDELVLAASIT